jgi:DUF4097 and DUF4098 domain-containing protein YvlB
MDWPVLARDSRTEEAEARALPEAGCTSESTSLRLRFLRARTRLMRKGRGAVRRLSASVFSPRSSPRLRVSAVNIIFIALPLCASAQQTTIACQNGRCTVTITGKARVESRLRLNGRGPVTLEAGAADSADLFYTARAVVRAPNEAAAKRSIELRPVQIATEDGWTVLATSWDLAVRAPRLKAASIATAEGPVIATGVSGSLTVDSIAGPLTVDRIAGDCTLGTRGGDIHAGEISGTLHATTGFGDITVRSARGQAVLQTRGGDIVVGEVDGPLRAETGGGEVRVDRAGASVEAVSGAGQVAIGSAKGLVTVHGAAGPVRVGPAGGVNCATSAGGIQMYGLQGSVRVATRLGSIMASLAGAPLADSYLTTGNGDITVIIPSNVGVTIMAENGMADATRRIVSEFPQIPVERQGMRLVAQGEVNGGGPVLRISSTIGTIFIKRQ